MIAAVVAMAASCTTQIEKVQIAPSEDFVAPELYAISDVVVNQDNNATEAVTFNWSSASFGAPVQIDYSLMLTSGEDEVLAGTSYTNSISISKADLNGLVCNELGISKNTTAKVGAYVMASIHGTDKSAKPSNAISFNISTYAAQLRSYYICGEFQKWTIAEAPQFWETDGGTNIYKILIDLDNSANADRTNDTESYFKITAAQDWSHDNWGYNFLTPAWTCPEQGDSNLSVPLAEGSVNILTVNVGKMTISRVPLAKGISIIGSFDESEGWGKDIKFTYDASANVWSTPAVTFSSGTDFLVRMDEDWNKKMGDGVKASEAVEGGFELNESGSAANINVPSTGTYVMKLYGNRTPMVIVMEKQ